MAFASVALAEHVAAGVHADLPGDRPVDDDDGADIHRGGEYAVHVEVVGADRLDCGDDDRQVVGLAAGHHGVDRDLLDGHVGEVRWHDGHDLVGGASGALEHPKDAGFGGGNDRQAVGPVPVVEGLPLVFEGGDLDPPAAHRRAGETHGEFVGAIGIDAQ